MSSSTVETQAPLATNVRIDSEAVTLELTDGRVVSAPIAWYPRLSHATPEERDQWRLIAGGRGVHWTEIDEDVSVENLLGGKPSGESQASFREWLLRRQSQDAKQ